MSQTAGKAADSKREEFRRYLEKAGVIDAFTKVLVALYESPDKPNSALEYIRQQLGGGGPEPADVEQLRGEVVELRQRNEALSEENSELRARISRYEEEHGPAQ